MFNRRILRIFALQYLYSQEIKGEFTKLKDKKEIIDILEKHRDLFFFSNKEILHILAYWYLRCKISQETRDSFICDYIDISNKNILENPYMKSIYEHIKDHKAHHNLSLANLKKYSNIVFNKVLKDDKKFNTYLKIKNPTSIDHIKITLYLLDIVFKNDLIEEYIDIINYNFVLIKSISLNLLKKKIKTMDIKNFDISESIDKKNFSCMEENEFFYKLVSGVRKHYKEINNLAIKKIYNWNEDRLEIIDKLLIYLGIFEILYFDIPKSIIINEYVEISKKYCTPKSSKFINGILDNIKKNNIDYDM